MKYRGSFSLRQMSLAGVLDKLHGLCWPRQGEQVTDNLLNLAPESQRTFLEVGGAVFSWGGSFRSGNSLPFATFPEGLRCSGGDEDSCSHICL